MEIADFQQLEVTSSSKRISNFATAISANSLGNKGLRTVSSLHSILSSDDDESINYFQDISKREFDDTIMPIQEKFLQSTVTQHNDDDRIHTEKSSIVATNKATQLAVETTRCFESNQEESEQDELDVVQLKQENHEQRKQQLSSVHQTSTATTNTQSTMPRLTIAKRRRYARQMVPSLFLQEATHLLSLLSAVAMCTLRNDIECASLPLEEYHTGTVPDPNVPLDDTTETQDEQNKPKKDLKKSQQSSAWKTILSYLLGTTRSSKQRTLYNAKHPLGVIGGISDNEIKFLQRARGPYAKVAVVTMWFEEFISREYCNGSMGTVPPPFISRLYSIVSDGTVAYNQARKIAYVPFPFPNAQITSFFSMAIIFIFPLLYDEYVSKYWFAAVLNFITVLCFLGLHEVARELENPFINVPNDLPLVTFQDEFNDALLTMYSGFHPDSYWEIKPILHGNKNDTTADSDIPFDDNNHMTAKERLETNDGYDNNPSLSHQQHSQNQNVHEPSFETEYLNHDVSASVDCSTIPIEAHESKEENGNDPPLSYKQHDQTTSFVVAYPTNIISASLDSNMVPIETHDLNEDYDNNLSVQNDSNQNVHEICFAIAYPAGNVSPGGGGVDSNIKPKSTPESNEVFDDNNPTLSQQQNDQNQIVNDNDFIIHPIKSEYSI
jgi:Bestrophin, RFP-TM, chloride channel